MKDSKNLVIGMLCAVICILSVAYAAFSTTLNINGTSTVTSRWGVKIVDAWCIVYQDGGATTIEQPDAAACTESSTKACANVTIESDTLATVTMELVEPDDAAECWIIYENTGTLDAKLTQTVTGVDGSTTLGTRAIIVGTTGTEATKVLEAGKGHEVYVTAYYQDVKDEQGNSVDLTAADKTAEVHIVTVATQNME